MKIKRFIAKSMRDAIRQVRDEQGPHAVILSNRRVTGGVEVVAATDYDAALAHQALRQDAQAAAETGTTQAVPDEVPPARIPLHVPLHAPMQEPEAVAPPPTTRKPQTTNFTQPTLVAGVQPKELTALHQELGSMRQLIEEQLSGLFWNELKRSQPLRAAVMMALSRLGLDADLARSIADALPPDTDRERARLLPLGVLAARLPIGPEDPILEGGVFALVGPTGVGKTTTIAKLAARFARRNRPRDIALVTLDHYRIGAQEQLFSYGRLLGVPVHSLPPEQDLAALLAQLSDHRLVLIDTAGMSQRDRTLSQQIDRLRSVGPSLRSYIVLAANAASGDDVVRRYAPLNAVGCVLTKLDEATSIGSVLSTVIRHSLSVSYVSEGQRVPEDLQTASADALILAATQLARATPKTLDDDCLAFSFANTTANKNSIHA